MAVDSDRIHVAQRFLQAWPALLVAGLIARGFELALGMPVDARWLHDSALALALEAVAIVSALPLLFLVSLPVLLIRRDRTRTLTLGILWSVLLLAQIILMQYFLTARQALGSDLFGYSLPEIRQTVQGTPAPDVADWLHLIVPLGALWLTLRWRVRRGPPPRSMARAALAIGVVALLIAPSQARLADRFNADRLVLNKGAHFVESSLKYFWGRGRAPVNDSPASAQAVIEGFTALDPQYPFLHREQTPDVLGPRLRPTAGPPNLVIVIVEGLGRSFSGPGAPLGSFTPYLDELAARSLYFENFLANQGRTFGILPTLLGSLPFGEHGFANLQPPPPHATLLSILEAQGYHTRFYAGFDLQFDNMRQFLEQQQVDRIVDAYSYDARYPFSESGWGYADGELVARALADETRDAAQPSLVVLKTSTMHPFYKFPAMERYVPRLEQRLAELGIPEQRRAPYRQSSDIYRSILYTDDSLRRLVVGLERTSAWSNTVLVVIGDHSLAELPLRTSIARFHVPLLIHSPLLKQPARIKAVSSQMDLAPSLLAYVTHCCGLRSPAAVTWLGSGLDLGEGFGNRHEIALKLSKTELEDFVQGRLYLSRGQLFELGDGMSVDPVDDPAARMRLEQALARFVEANRSLAATGKLMPAGRPSDWVAYREADRVLPAPASWAYARAGSAVTLVVTDVRIAEPARPGALSVSVDFDNHAATRSAPFVPLVVVLTENGRELTETYGRSMSLGPGQAQTVTLAVNAELPQGRYLLAVIPSDPATGKAIGRGRHGVIVSLQ